jgi:hypothetical protein
MHVLDFLFAVLLVLAILVPWYLWDCWRGNI